VCMQVEEQPASGSASFMQLHTACSASVCALLTTRTYRFKIRAVGVHGEGPFGPHADVNPAAQARKLLRLTLTTDAAATRIGAAVRGRQARKLLSAGRADELADVDRHTKIAAAQRHTACVRRHAATRIASTGRGMLARKKIRAGKALVLADADREAKAASQGCEHLGTSLATPHEAPLSAVAEAVLPELAAYVWREQNALRLEWSAVLSLESPVRDVLYEFEFAAPGGTQAKLLSVEDHSCAPARCSAVVESWAQPTGTLLRVRANIGSRLGPWTAWVSTSDSSDAANTRGNDRAEAASPAQSLELSVGERTLEDALRALHESEPEGPLADGASHLLSSLGSQVRQSAMFSPTDSDSASVGWSRADSPESNSSHESELLIQIDYGSSPEVDRWEALKLSRPSVRPLRTDGIHGREKFHSNIDHIEFSGSSSSDFDLNQPDLNEGDFDSDGRLSPEDRHNGPAAEVLHISAIAQSSSILPLRGEERGISGPTGLASMLVSDAIEEERFRHTGTEAARAAEDQRLRHEEQARREEQARLRREAEERALQDERAPLQYEKAQRASHEEQASLQR
jgi:hypothetical protein